MLGQMNLSHQVLDTDLTQMTVTWWLDQAMLAQAKDDLQFVTHFSETCDLCNTDLRWFLWVLSFVDFYCFSNLIIICYFCLVYFDAASSVSSYCVRHCGEESWDIEWMKNIGWDWLRCREAKPIMIKDVMLMPMLINKTGQGLCSGPRSHSHLKARVHTSKLSYTHNQAMKCPD